jgi:hypothetical protein
MMVFMKHNKVEQKICNYSKIIILSLKGGPVVVPTAKKTYWHLYSTRTEHFGQMWEKSNNSARDQRIGPESIATDALNIITRTKLFDGVGRYLFN